MKRFERKFGAGILESLPDQPGVYRFLDADGATIYVGKSRSLRKRLTQYSRARRGKMRKIVMAASSLEWELLDSEMRALLHELSLIQKLNPKLNVSGRFSYLYPFIGIYRYSTHEWGIALGTQPATMTDFDWYGCYRSRMRVRGAYRGLAELLTYVAHPTPLTAAQKQGLPAYTSLRIFRRLPETLSGCIVPFLLGQSDRLMHDLFAALLDSKGARAKAADLQEHFEALEDFWENEAVPLAQAIQKTVWTRYPVTQSDRDALFLLAKGNADDPATLEKLIQESLGPDSL